MNEGHKSYKCRVNLKYCTINLVYPVSVRSIWRLGVHVWANTHYTVEQLLVNHYYGVIAVSERVATFRQTLRIGILL